MTIYDKRKVCQNKEKLWLTKINQEKTNLQTSKVRDLAAVASSRINHRLAKTKLADQRVEKIHKLT